jgi:hypothetical protein
MVEYHSCRQFFLLLPTTLHLLCTSELSAVIRTSTKTYFIRISRLFSPDVKRSAKHWKSSKQILLCVSERNKIKFEKRLTGKEEFNCRIERRQLVV